MIFKRLKNGGREYIFRQSVHSIIEALPYDKLSELFNFIITDPNSDESKSKFMNPNTPMHIIEKLKYLEINDLIEFETTIKI